MSKNLPAQVRSMIVASTKDLPKYLTLDEIHRILSVNSKEEDYISWFLCFMLARTGARISELMEVGVADIDFSLRTIKIKTLKQRGNVVRIVPIQQEAIGAIGEWIARRALTRNDKLFKFGRKMAHIRVKAICKMAGIDDSRCHPHTFRHSYAIINLAQGVPVTVVQEWLGHSNIMNTLIYTRIIAQHSKHFADQIQW